MSVEELLESELGTQEYWDKRYKCEIKNYRNNGDVGDVWFGEESIDRVCNWIFKSSEVSKNSKIIDLGCGNGLVLIELSKEGYTNLTGVDYSEDAIRLANEIAQKENASIIYKTFDILKNEPSGTYNLVHDKGTYDAISLSSDAKTNREIYIEKVLCMLENDGVFIITSCNWTQSELEVQFDGKFRLVHIIPTPQFRFGGKTGSIVTSVIFKKCN